MTVHIDHHKDYAETLKTEGDKPQKIDVFNKYITLTGNLDDAQKARLLAIADKCPVHRTLHGEVEIITSLSDDKKTTPIKMRGRH